MRTHVSRPKTGLLAASLIGVALAAPPSAHAVYTDVPDFHLTESYATYGSYTATSNTGVYYRWLDSPWKWNEVTANSCFSGAPFGGAVYAPGNTSYQMIGLTWSGSCFLLRGRTLPGQGHMFYYDGRMNR